MSFSGYRQARVYSYRESGSVKHRFSSCSRCFEFFIVREAIEPIVGYRRTGKLEKFHRHTNTPLESSIVNLLFD